MEIVEWEVRITIKMKQKPYTDNKRDLRLIKARV
jgi:hypothetical protein